MKPRWSPRKAAIVAFVAVVLFGFIASLIIMSVTGVLDNDPFRRGQVIGVPLAILGLLAGWIAYTVQSKRNPDAF